MIQVLRETHETPPEVNRCLEFLGGKNRFGDPHFRAVWGWNRLGWIGGKWTDYDDSGNVVRESMDLRFVPKYPKHDRWHIERWVAPECYGPPWMWYAQTIEIADGVSIPALGPYPDRGEYECLFTLENPDGTFLQLNSAIAEEVYRRFQFQQHLSYATRRGAAEAVREQKDKDWRRKAADVLGYEPSAPGQFAGQSKYKAFQDTRSN